MRSMYRRYIFNSALVATALCLNGQPVGAFTQAGGTIIGGYKFPTGHEYITVRAAKWAIDEADKRTKIPEQKDSASVVLNQLQKSPHPAPPSSNNYDAPYHNIWATVMGQRFVDLGGFAFTWADSRLCWEAVTQMQEEGQADHFLRRHSKEDEGEAGRLKAIEHAKARLRQVFLTAVKAGDHTIQFQDGGGTSTNLRANKAYFLLGRAVHLVQDSFSPEHGKRNPNLGYSTIMDIKSYVCTRHSAQHTHTKPFVRERDHGDNIWKTTAAQDDPSNATIENLRPEAKAAVYATSYLMSAFAVAHADPNNDALAKALIDAFMEAWMKVDKEIPVASTELDQNQADCERDIEWQVRAYDHVRWCLSKIRPEVLLTRKPENTQDSDYIDPYMLFPYHWEWTGTMQLSVLGQIPAYEKLLTSREMTKPGKSAPSPTIPEHPPGPEPQDPVDPKQETFGDTQVWSTVQGDKSPNLQKAQAEELKELQEAAANLHKKNTAPPKK